MSKLNSKTLTIGAVVLLVLALLFVATPLLRVSGISGRSGFNQPSNGQFPSGGQNGFPNQGNGFQGQGNSTNPSNPTNTTRQFGARNRGLLGFAFLSGITGTIVYALALLVSLAAALGMFLTKRWGQVLGIVMAVVYLLLGLLSFIPMFLLGFARALNGLNLGLSILHLVLAIAVIVLALIPAKKMIAPVAADVGTPPAVGE